MFSTELLCLSEVCSSTSLLLNIYSLYESLEGFNRSTPPPPPPPTMTLSDPNRKLDDITVSKTIRSVFFGF